MVDWKKLKRKIPNSIQVGTTSFEILWVDRFNNESVLGETRFNPNQIVIKKGLSPKETVKTYFHEVLHSISEVYGVGLTESQVLALEKSFYYILKPENLLKK